MITIEQYWSGRDSRYRSEWTETIQKNGIETHRRVGLILMEAEADGVPCGDCTSGWRPKSVNDQTANSSSTSKHMTAEAEDVGDFQTRALQLWCVTHQDRLCKHELWIEHPGWCAKQLPNGEWVFWVHFQTVPPPSGKRVYIPNNKPIVFPLPGFGKPIPERLKL